MKSQQVTWNFSKIAEWLAHILLWTFMIAERWINRHPMALEDSITLLFIIIQIYTLIFFIIPTYFKRKKWLSFIAGVLILFIVSDVLRSLVILASLEWRSIPFNTGYEFSKWAFDEYRTFDRFIFSSNPWAIYLAFSYVLIRDWIMNDKIKARLSSEKATMELAFLKSQMDPHFLFNTLNNLYALALEEKAPKTAETVTKIGTLMRYSLHDSQSDKILVSKEIDYIEKYIELEKLRLPDASQTHIRFAFIHNGLSHETIAPMILIPFIENAFKHGISSTRKPDIGIEISLSGNTLILEVRNTTYQNGTVESGIGLTNVRNRLQLIYPHMHKLETQAVDNSYYVHLEIDLRR